MGASECKVAVPTEVYWTADGALVIEFADRRPIVRLDWVWEDKDPAFNRRVFASEAPAREAPAMDRARYERFTLAGL